MHNNNIMVTILPNIFGGLINFRVAPAIIPGLNTERHSPPLYKKLLKHTVKNSTMWHTN